MAIRDNQLDDAITLILETQTIVTARQKAAAWQQLRDQAAHQVILAPYAIPPRSPVPRRARLYEMTMNALRSLMVLLTDDSVYYRAAANRHITGMTHTVGGEIIVQYFPHYPLRPMYHHAI